MTHSKLLRHIRILRWCVVIAAALWMGVFFHVPNPMRAFVPTVFGMTEIAPGVYTDDARYTQHILTTIKDGAEMSEGFFGDLHATPWFVVCTTKACDERFGTVNRADAYKDQFIRVGHTGIHASVLAHELVHTELYRIFRDTDQGPGILPAWLNEGLATYISGDDRPTRFSTPDALWVLEAQHLSDWHRLTHTRSWQDTYGAAQSLVASLDVSLGRDGLLDLLGAMQQGQSAHSTIQTTILNRMN